jgi:Bacterial transglutaminase-like cysteine proteinase BTLCP
MNSLRSTCLLTCVFYRNETSTDLPRQRWSIDPVFGDCNDYAVSKRHELLTRGWPMGDLLLSEVVIPSGEHHLVLVARTSTADLVLGNMQPLVRDWVEVEYRWVRIQVPNFGLNLRPDHDFTSSFGRGPRAKTASPVTRISSWPTANSSTQLQLSIGFFNCSTLSVERELVGLVQKHPIAACSPTLGT